MTEPHPRGSLSADYLLDRRRRWLLEHFPADLSILVPSLGDPYPVKRGTLSNATVQPCCRCYCCGKLLGARALFVSLTDPTKGTRTNNLRPACADHASTL